MLPGALPYGLAVDGTGNVYIADTGNGRVLKETLSAGNYIQSMIAYAACLPLGSRWMEQATSISLIPAITVC